MLVDSAILPDVPRQQIAHGLKVADAVWIATATLHRSYPDRDRFDTKEIVTKVQKLHLTEAAEQSIWQHVHQHCVANREPKPNRPRMLYALGTNHRRLFRDGDDYASSRQGSPTHPDWDILPQQYKNLRDWYESEWNKQGVDPLLGLVGSGTHLYKEEHADEFLAHLRSNWGGMA